MTEIRITVPFTPRTKKTSNRLVKIGGKGAHRILPSEAWMEWRDLAVPLLKLAMAQAKASGRAPWAGAAGTSIGMRAFIEGWAGGAIGRPVNCAAIFYRDALRGDLVGFMQGLADILQEEKGGAGIVTDDRWITQWDGSRLEKDAKNPRTEVVLTILGGTP